MPASLSITANVPGLSAWLHRGPHDEADELTAQSAAGISAWADIDSGIGHLAMACDCGCETVLVRGGLGAEACTSIGSHTAPPRLGLLRRLHIACLERRLDIVRDERDRYAHAGAIGPTYHRNSLLLQLQLMARIRELQGLQ